MNVIDKKKARYIIFLALIVLIFIPFFNMFTITDLESNKVVYINNIKNIEYFHTSFIHSVNRTPVNEYYKIVDNKFVIYKTTFHSYGAGMPDFEDIGQKPRLEEGAICIDDLDITMDSFSVFIGTIAKHSLHFGNESIYLSELAKPGKLVSFRIKKVSLYTLLRRFLYE